MTTLEYGSDGEIHARIRLNSTSPKPKTLRESLEEQRRQVEGQLQEDGQLSAAVLQEEVKFWYDELGLPEHYFHYTAPEVVAKHILSFRAAKMMASASGRSFDINLRQEDSDMAMFAARSFVVGGDDESKQRIGLSATYEEEASPVVKVERYIECKYISGVNSDPDPNATLAKKFWSFIPETSMSAGANSELPEPVGVWRLQAFRSLGPIDEVSKVHLRLYFLQAPKFVEPNPVEGETSIQLLGDESFLRTTNKKLLAMYQRTMDKCVAHMGPAIELEHDPTGNGESVLMIGHLNGSTHSYFTGIPDVYRYYLMFSTRKYVEPFANGMVIFTFYLKSLDAVESTDGEVSRPKKSPKFRLEHIKADASLHYVLPATSITPLLKTAALSAQQSAYAYAAWKYAFHFLNRGMKEFNQMEDYLKQANPSMLSTLEKLRSSLKTHAFTEGTILQSIYACADIIPFLYDDFARRHMPSTVNRHSPRSRTLSNALPAEVPMGDEEALAHIRKHTKTEAQFNIFRAIHSFNKHILRTNFYKPRKTAISFRLSPECLPESDYKERPFGLYFIIGAEFRGFHIRFRDVARGGIRLVRSPYAQAYANNVSTVFDECFNLASTQQRKNKDIPEGGSKGVILLNLAHQVKGRVAFEKFVDSILDLTVPNEEWMVDYLEREELLFLGPDEGTAEMMDWASAHARRRGYKYWKAFTTGKSLHLGGIPHDLYGMTTNSVRQYILGIQEKLGLDPATAVKVQTGGPDGDLGSNEIKEANERTIAIVDGSGVLYDPAGIDRSELLRLANGRKMVVEIEKDRISDKGFLVLTSETDVTLPNGTVVESGMNFRNKFHLNELVAGDFFVPCGGRPNSVTGETVDQFLFGSADQREGATAPRFKYVVEGANLFFTQEARLKMEQAGLIVFKDASANKGGVTSSSLEVLAALTLNDAEFEKHMAVLEPENVPDFYQRYVKDAQEIIRRNARLEFECLWREHEQTGKPRSVLSDELSVKITTLSARIEDNDTLWGNVELRKHVLLGAIPPALVAVVAFEEMVTRLPENYLRALFGSQLASKFIYQFGLETPEFAFFQYVSEFVSS